MSKKSCLGSLLKGTLILFTFPISIPIMLLKSKKSNGATIKNRNDIIRIVFNTDTPSKFKHKTNTELYNAAVLYAQNGAGIIHDSSNLIYTTENPKVFFKRYSLLVERLHNNAIIEKSFPRLFNKPQKAQYERAISEIEKTEATNAMVNRYLGRIDRLKTPSAKRRKAEEYFRTLASYSSEMTEASRSYCADLLIAWQEKMTAPAATGAIKN